MHQQAQLHLHGSLQQSEHEPFIFSTDWYENLVTLSSIEIFSIDIQICSSSELIMIESMRKFK